MATAIEVKDHPVTKKQYKQLDNVAYQLIEYECGIENVALRHVDMYMCIGKRSCRVSEVFYGDEAGDFTFETLPRFFEHLTINVNVDYQLITHDEEGYRVDNQNDYLFVDVSRTKEGGFVIHKIYRKDD